MKADETVYLRHILDAIAKVEMYLQGVDETAFAQASLIQDGVIRQIEIIGEATRRLSRSFRLPVFRNTLGRHCRHARQTHS
jgi:uncharacterized protein with HEPN domain